MDPLQPKVAEVMEEHTRSAIASAIEYWKIFVSKHEKELGEDNQLPLSGLLWKAGDADEHAALADISFDVKLRSRFVAMAGRGETVGDVASVSELCSTTRQGLFMDSRFIPACEVKQPINSFVLDYWRAPNYTNLLKYNKVSENHAWSLLKHFAISVKATFKSLERRNKFAPYKRGIHGEGRHLETVFSDPQVQTAFNSLQLDFCSKFNKISKEQDS
eukprot:422416-Hanusia_phi.AAC.2